MRRKVILTAARAVVAFVFAVELAHAQEAPQAKRRLIVQEVDFVVPDVEALADLAGLSDAVSHVRILSRRVERRPSQGSPSQDIVTVYTAQIVEAYKKHGHVAIPSSTFTFVQRGGELDTPTEVLVADSGPRLSRAEEYLVFLKWSEGLDSLELSYGASAAFQLSGGAVVPLGRTKLQQKVRGMRAADVLAELRRLRAP